MNRSIALIGLSGTGKSTVGRRLAARLGWPLRDTDALVIAADPAGRSVAQIFAEDGEPAFRAREAQALAAALDGGPAVIATGGGAVLRAANQELLKSHCFVVWLDAPTAMIVARLAAHAEERPLLAADPTARLETLRQQRAPIYAACADLRLDVVNADPDALAAMIAAKLSTDYTDYAD